MFKINSLALTFLTISLLNFLNGVESSRILAVLGLPNPAENIFGTALLNALNERGHDITVIIRFYHDMKLHKNINKIRIDEGCDIFKDFLSISAENFNETLFHNVQKFYGKSVLLTLNIFKNPQVKEILQNSQFDLIMIEALMSEALFGLGEYFAAPMVAVSNFFNTEPLNALVDNYSPLSIVPSIFIQHTFEAKFSQRFLNVALYAFDKLGYAFCSLPQQRQVYKEIFPNASLSFDQANRNFSLVLLNQHFSFSYPRPYVPNMIEVAGLHIYDNLPPLQLQKFLNESKEEIIYVSLYSGGNNFKMPFYNYIASKLLNGLKDLHYKVIWHVDYVPPEGLTDSSFYLATNASHFSILAHPKVSLFVTYGDIENIIDAVHFGKPLLGLPYFAHHHINVNMITTAGYGLGIKFRSLCEVKFKSAVLKLLNNNTYLEKVKYLSSIFRDQPMKPRDKAIYWIEYVLRHKGAEHLMSKGRFLNCWLFYNIDVYLAYFAIFLSVVFVSLMAMKCLSSIVNKIMKCLKIKFKKS